MPEPKDWKEINLRELVEQGIKESSTLEYKACSALDKKDSKRKEEVGKDVSAMANAAGGTIVYGIVEKGHMPRNLDDGYDPGQITREWLEDVIASNMQPKIEPLVLINQVELETRTPGRVAYVVCIPQSERRPHQASDRRYYRRKNFEVDPMEDYEVRDMMFRQQVPEVVLADMLVHIVASRCERNSFGLRLGVSPIVENTGLVMARQSAVEIRVHPPLVGLVPTGLESVVSRFAHGGTTILTIPDNGALFPSQRRITSTVAIEVTGSNPDQAAAPPLDIVVYAESMSPHVTHYQLLENTVVGAELARLRAAMRCFE